MREPQPVRLTPAERRALRLIADSLSEEDPVLSRLLGASTERERPRRWWAIIVCSYTCVALAVFTIGTVGGDTAVRGWGTLMLLMIPFVAAAAAEISDPPG